MVDRLSKKHRSWNMSRIKCHDTDPEMAVRSLLHEAGFRFRVHVASLPGKPDIVLPKYRTAILVHGCFWHRHNKCKYTYTPKSNLVFWEKKFESNVRRDVEVRKLLRRLGWKVLVIWECELHDPDAVIMKIKRFFRVAKASRQRKR